MKRVVIGLSGGVDSSVAAYLLKQQGYDVVGLFMVNWHDTTGTLEGDCPWHDDRTFAELVAKRLDIPLHIVDLSDQYRTRVVDYMFAEYERGRTPNPDVLCNREIKFDVFLKEALALGADYVATGHYCRKDEVIAPDGSTVYRLLAGSDPNKDQSYFLCQLSQEQLKYALFPVGDLLKPEVRRIADAQRLATAKRKDSQGICFVGKVDLPLFLQQKLAARSGNVHEILPTWPKYAGRPNVQPQTHPKAPDGCSEGVLPMQSVQHPCGCPADTFRPLSEERAYIDAQEASETDASTLQHEFPAQERQEQCSEFRQDSDPYRTHCACAAAESSAPEDRHGLSAPTDRCLPDDFRVKSGISRTETPCPANVPEAISATSALETDRRTFVSASAATANASVGTTLHGPVGVADPRELSETALALLAEPWHYTVRDGKKIGTHNGAHFYTIGQRKGLGIGGRRESLFVLATDVVENVVYVGEGDSHPGLYRKALFIQSSEIHWVDPLRRLTPGQQARFSVRIRYRQPLQGAELIVRKQGAYLLFDEPQRGITAGQFAAWYDGDELVGSGVISE